MECFLLKNLAFIVVLFATMECGFAQQNNSFLCEGVEVNTYVRNVTDCTAYIKCKANNDIVTGKCPKTYFFSQAGQYCTTQALANCYVCPDKTALLATYAVENSTRRYIRCIKGVPTELICDEDSYFNNSSGQCEIGSAPGLECPLNLSPGEFTARHDPANCSIGLICLGDPEPFSFECSPQLHFYLDTLNCGNPSNSGCSVS